MPCLRLRQSGCKKVVLSVSKLQLGHVEPGRRRACASVRQSCNVDDIWRKLLQATHITSRILLLGLSIFSCFSLLRRLRCRSVPAVLSTHHIDVAHSPRLRIPMRFLRPSPLAQRSKAGHVSLGHADLTVPGAVVWSCKLFYRRTQDRQSRSGFLPRPIDNNGDLLHEPGPLEAHDVTSIPTFAAVC